MRCLHASEVADRIEIPAQQCSLDQHLSLTRVAFNQKRGIKVHTFDTPQDSQDAAKLAGIREDLSNSCLNEDLY